MVFVICGPCVSCSSWQQARDEQRLGTRVQAELEEQTAGAAAAAAAAVSNQKAMEKEKYDAERM